MAQKRPHDALMNDILASKGFKDVSKRSALLRYLYKKYPKMVTAEEIWSKALGETRQPWDDNRVRERCLHLRRGLDDHFSDTYTGWRCMLPAGVRTEGWQLEFVDRGSLSRPTNLFWQPHLSSLRNITVFFDELLFYVDRNKRIGFRFFELDGEAQTVALLELKRTHPGFFNKHVRVMYLPPLGGTTNAQDRIETWFDRQAMIRIEKRNCRNIDGDATADRSPIIICGVTRCEFVRDVFAANKHLDFTMKGGERGFATVNIRKPSVKASTFLDDDPDGRVYAIITRIRHPFGEGCLTLINSEHASASDQVARALTDDDRLNEVFAGMGISLNKPLPPSFQWLFAVERGQVKRETGVTQLRLVDHRLYS
jgi:hypothetical protein